MTASTLRLLDWIARENAHIFNPGPQSSLDYTLYMAVMALDERARQELGQEHYRKQPWSAPPELEEILRESLRENPSTHVAYALVRCGCRRPETLALLHPWDAYPFLTHQENAPALMGEHFTLAMERFGQHAVVAGIRDIGFEPDHHELFERLCASVDVDVAPVTQTFAGEFVPEPTVVTDGARDWNVPVHRVEGGFLIEHARGSFRAAARGTWMDVDAVLRHFDELMQRLNRPERAFRLAGNRVDNDEWVVFVTCDPKTFPENVPLANPC